MEPEGAANGTSTPTEAPAPGVRPWHVGPLVDSLAYHWSWLWALVPLLFMGETKQDYLALWIGVLALNFAHRHLTLPIVYLDKQVFAQHRDKFTWAPLAMLVVFCAEPLLRTGAVGRVVFASVATLSGAWGIWHTLQQKYGILRVYAVKSGLPLELRPPAWSDRLLVHGWYPLWVAVLGTSYQQQVQQYFGRARLFLDPLLHAMPLLRTWLLPPAALLAATGAAAFFYYEWRGCRLRNPARLSMGLATALLSLSFLVFDPVKAFLAYTFSHAVEYFVFVWAFQRKRYATTVARPSLMARMARHPGLFYGSFLLLTCATYVLAKHWGTHVLAGTRPVRWAGIAPSQWLYYWAIVQSMVHFYYDGFLWKMRNAQTRANL